MSENDAQVYFMTYRALLQEVDNIQPVSNQSLQAANRDLPFADFAVDVRCFAIYIAL